MLELVFWVTVYSVVVALSIILIGNPTTLSDGVTFTKLLSLLIDWRFMLGGLLAIGARFIFVIINQVIAKNPNFEKAHLTLTALATTVSIIFVVIANYLFLGESLRPAQILGSTVMIMGLFLIFR